MKNINCHLPRRRRSLRPNAGMAPRSAAVCAMRRNRGGFARLSVMRRCELVHTSSSKIKIFFVPTASACCCGHFSAHLRGRGPRHRPAAAQDQAWRALSLFLGPLARNPFRLLESVLDFTLNLFRLAVGLQLGSSYRLADRLLQRRRRGRARPPRPNRAATAGPGRVTIQTAVPYRRGNSRPF